MDRESIDLELLDEFLSSCREGISELEETLLGLERLEASDRVEAVESVRRRIHTLKGECGVLSLHTGQELCHEAEGMVDRYPRLDQAEPVEALLSLIDWFRQYLKDLAVQNFDPPDATVLRKTLQAGHQGDVARRLVVIPAEALEDDTFGDYLEEMRGLLDSVEGLLLQCEKDGAGAERIGQVFGAFHTIKGLSGFYSLDEVVALAHAAETLLEEARAADRALVATELDLLFRLQQTIGRILSRDEQRAPAASDVEDLLKNIARPVRAEPAVPVTEAPVVDGEPVASETAASTTSDAVADGTAPSAATPATGAGESRSSSPKRPVSPMAAASREPRSKPVRAPASGVRARPMASGTSPARPVPNAAAVSSDDRRKTVTREIHDTVKVPTRRLDHLVDMIGELVIAEQMVTEGLKDTNLDESCSRGLHTFVKITRDLQDMAMRLRLVNLKSTFQRLSRMVRDLARKVGKDVRLVATGHELELDRTVVEGIADPLVHLLRNAIDHGIESPEQRVAAGKSARAVIALRAYKRGSFMVIEVADDGCGLDRQRILDKALRTGLREGERASEMADADVYRLILRSGFSTSSKVTDLSGRGVGMDVVRRSVESLRGRLDIESKSGEGTTFRVVLPLTLAILEGLVVRCGAEKYVLPLASVEVCCEPDDGELEDVVELGTVYRLRGRPLPVYSLSELLAGPSPDSDECVLVVVRTSRGRACVRVDHVVGQQQAVIKNMGALVPEITGVSGGTILGDGQISLILDVDQLLEGHACTPDELHAGGMT